MVSKCQRCRRRPARYSGIHVGSGIHKALCVECEQWAYRRNGELGEKHRQLRRAGVVGGKVHIPCCGANRYSSDP